MFWKHFVVCLATEVPFHENLSPLPLRRSSVPDSKYNISLLVFQYFSINRVFCDRLHEVWPDITV